MSVYSFENLGNQLAFFNSIKEDYLYNFSLTFNMPLIGPHMLQLVLTTKCNLECAMCGVWKASEEELETFYIKKIIDDTYKMGNLQEVYFTGGEALLRPDIFTLIKYVKDYYPFIKTSLNTNGSLLNKKNIDRLIDVQLDTLSISIDSPVPEIHNVLRGSHVLEKVIDALNYINAEKEKRNAQYPVVVTCSILMNQTLDTMYGMLDFCIKYNINSIHIQPYVCNSDLRGEREDKFWIPKERLSVLCEVLEKIERQKGKIPLIIEIPTQKVIDYFSNPRYVDKCYAGFTRAIVVGKKISFVCNGPNNEKYQHFGVGNKDAINEVWFSEKANYFRETIKACKRNCAQFCSIRPSSDSIADIHQRLIKHDNLFLVFRELNFLKEYILKYPMLPIREVIESNFYYLLENLRGLLGTIKNVQFRQYDNETKQYLLSDLKLINDYTHNVISKSDFASSSMELDNKNIDSINVLEEVNSYKREIEQYFLLKEKENKC